MLKNGMFMMTVGFVALILGLVEPYAGRKIVLLAAVALIVIGFILYYRGEKEEE